MVNLPPDGSIYPLTGINLPLAWGKLSHRNTFFSEVIFSRLFVISAFFHFQLIDNIPN